MSLASEPGELFGGVPITLGGTPAQDRPLCPPTNRKHQESDLPLQFAFIPLQQGRTQD